MSDGGASVRSLIDPCANLLRSIEVEDAGWI
jgi:hypothetical protein